MTLCHLEILDLQLCAPFFTWEGTRGEWKGNKRDRKTLEIVKLGGKDKKRYDVNKHKKLDCRFRKIHFFKKIYIYTKSSKLRFIKRLEIRITLSSLLFFMFSLKLYPQKASKSLKIF